MSSYPCLSSKVENPLHPFKEKYHLQVGSIYLNVYCTDDLDMHISHTNKDQCNCLSDTNGIPQSYKGCFAKIMHISLIKYGGMYGCSKANQCQIKPHFLQKQN